MKILHVLHHSVPHLDGYCVRSSQIVRLQRQVLKWQPAVVTSPKQEPLPTKASEVIDGITYYRILNPTTVSVPYLNQLRIISQLQERLEAVVVQDRPDLIHAHSPSLCGLAALKVARRHRIPLAYEIRAFWEDSVFDRGKNPRWSPRYWISRRLETRVMREAQAVSTIAENMQSDLIARGIAPEKLFVTPNGVESMKFMSKAPDHELQKRLDLSGNVILGYVGSLYRWEGVETLVRAMVKVVARSPNCKLVIVGGGEQETSLRSLIAELNLQSVVRLIGRVPHEEVASYYSIMDVLVYPRKRSRTTELVTPLKPLEAQAMGKPILASDVGGLVELTGGMGTKYFRSEDEDDIVSKCIDFIALTPEEREKLGEEGRVHVRQSRDWSAIIQSYKPFYQYAMSSLSG